MHREAEPAKRLEQLLDGVRQDDGTGGVGQKARACDESHDAHRHQYSIPDALRVNGQKSELEHRVALPRDKEEVQHRRKDDDGEDGLQALEDEPEGNFRHCVHRGEEDQRKRKAQRVGRRKEQHDIQDGQHQLEPGVKTMDEAVAGEVLADGNISQHPAAPPFCSLFRGKTRVSPASRRAFAARIILTA